MTMLAQERSYWLMRLARVADEAAPELGHGITAVREIQRRQRWRRELYAGELSEECRDWLAMTDRRGTPVGAALALGPRDGGKAWRRLRDEERDMQVVLGHASFDRRRCEACQRALRNLPLLVAVVAGIGLVLMGIVGRPLGAVETELWLLLGALAVLGLRPLQRVHAGYKARCDAKDVEAAVERARSAVQQPLDMLLAETAKAAKGGDDWSSVAASWRVLGVPSPR